MLKNKFANMSERMKAFFKGHDLPHYTPANKPAPIKNIKPKQSTFQCLKENKMCLICRSQVCDTHNQGFTYSLMDSLIGHICDDCKKDSYIQAKLEKIADNVMAEEWRTPTARVNPHTQLFTPVKIQEDFKASILNQRAHLRQQWLMQKRLEKALGI